MDRENTSDKNKILLKDDEVINPNNKNPQEGNVIKPTEKDNIQSPCIPLSRTLQLQEFSLPTLNFDSNISDDLPYLRHTLIENSSEFDKENHEEKIDCCSNLHERYHNLYSCHIEESNLLENNAENKNVKLLAKKQNKPDRLDDILAAQICIYEESPENYCEPQKDLDVPPPAYGKSPWKQNQLDIEKEQKDIREAGTYASKQYADDLKVANTSDVEEEEEEEEEDDTTYLEEQEALLNSYKDELHNKRDLTEQNNNNSIIKRPPERRGERPPSRRGERSSDINSEEQPSSEGKQESSSCHDRYKMLNTPKRVGSVMESQSFNDSGSEYQSFRKTSDFLCSTNYENKTSQYYSSLNTVQKFFQTKIDVTNNVNSKFCTRKPTSLSSTSDNLPMNYSLAEMRYLGQHEPENRDDFSCPSTSADCYTIIEETSSDELLKEKKHEHNS